jgi:hypothetical protein
VRHYLLPDLLGADPMSRIPEIYAKSVVYIYPSIAAANAHKPGGATGFILLVPYDSDGQAKFHSYIVTNDHVIQESPAIVLRINTHQGYALIETTKADWYGHPKHDDLAVYIYDPPLGEHDVIGFAVRWLTTQKFIEDYDIGLGDDVFMVGRFRYHQGISQNIPTACFGNIAQMPIEPVVVKRKIDGEEMDFPQEAFLIELRSISGYSGSPVFLDISKSIHYDDSMNMKRSEASRYKLLGVIGGHFRADDIVVDDQGNKLLGTNTRSNSAMAYAIPAWKLQELLDMKNLKDERIRKENENPPDERVNYPTLDSSIEDDESLFSEEDFEQTLRKVSRSMQPPPDQEQSETSE